MADDQETPDINFTEETPDIDFSEIVGNSAVTEKAHFGSDEAEDIDDLDEPENYVENEDGGDDIDNDDDEDTNQAATDQPKHGKTWISWTLKREMTIKDDFLVFVTKCSRQNKEWPENKSRESSGAVTAG